MITAGAVGCKPVLDGVLKRRNDFFEIGRQLAATFDGWPQRERRRSDDASAERYCIQIVVEMWSSAAMKRIARLPHAWPAVFPSTRSSDVVAALVREKHVGTPIEALPVSLQPPRVPGQQRQVSIIGDDHEHVDILRIRLGGDDRPHEGNPADARDLASSRHESTQSVEQSPPVILEPVAHRPRVNLAEESARPIAKSRSNAVDQVFARSDPAARA
ncbi:MAG TPA: hypothetical protein VH575_07230 [Gemmataceae bacterium]